MSEIWGTKVALLICEYGGGLHEGILLRKLIKLYAYEAGPFLVLRCFDKW